MQHYYKRGGVSFTAPAGLIRPVEEDRINKIDDKGNADQEGRIPEQLAIIVRDHEIDGVYTEDHDQEAVQHLEIGHEIIRIPEDHALDQPDQTGKDDKDRIQLLSVPHQPPFAKLPGDQQPFEKHIDDNDQDVVHPQYHLNERIDQFRESCQQHQNKKGLIAALFYSLQMRQPRNNGKLDGCTKKK
jgi:hypothetical protein